MLRYFCFLLSQNQKLSMTLYFSFNIRVSVTLSEFLQ